jgi:hypothetical protein
MPELQFRAATGEPKNRTLLLKAPVERFWGIVITMHYWKQRSEEIAREFVNRGHHFSDSASGEAGLLLKQG